LKGITIITAVAVYVIMFLEKQMFNMCSAMPLNGHWIFLALTWFSSSLSRRPFDSRDYNIL
jgi:hypothetical protein